MQNQASFSGLPTSQELASYQLGLFTKPAVAEAGSLAHLESIDMGVGVGGVDEMQNKAIDQPAWLQLAAEAGSWGLAELGNNTHVR